jgi:hypothetical protein
MLNWIIARGSFFSVGLASTCSTFRPPHERQLLALLVEARRATVLTQAQVAERPGKSIPFLAKVEDEEQRSMLLLAPCRSPQLR